MRKRSRLTRLTPANTDGAAEPLVIMPSDTVVHTTTATILIAPLTTIYLPLVVPGVMTT
jgi:hypothetical protein